MSRYPFEDPSGVEWVVGWDEPLVTFYAQREVPGAEEDLEDVAGTRIGEHTQPSSLVSALRDRVEIPADVLEQLQRETPQHAAREVARADQRAATVRDSIEAQLRRPPARGHEGMQL